MIWRKFGKPWSINLGKKRKMQGRNYSVQCAIYWAVLAHFFSGRVRHLITIQSCMSSTNSTWTKFTPRFCHIQTTMSCSHKRPKHEALISMTWLASTATASRGPIMMGPSRWAHHDGPIMLAHCDGPITLAHHDGPITLGPSCWPIMMAQWSWLHNFNSLW